jgi:hypothetical protein
MDARCNFDIPAFKRHVTILLLLFIENPEYLTEVRNFFKIHKVA